MFQSKLGSRANAHLHASAAIAVFLWAGIGAVGTTAQAATRIDNLGETAASTPPPGAVPAGGASANDNTSPKEGASVADIVVTAQRKSERLQDVPIAITAFDEQQVAAKGMLDFQSMTIQTPAIVISTANNFANIRIRGVGANTSTPGLEAPTAIYVDGLPLQNSIGANLGFLDIANVQVLEGPQGTLYGRNSTAGAILLNTANPTNHLEGHVSAEYGNYNHKKFEGVFNTPLTENLAIRIAARYDDRDGYVTNLAGGPKLGDYRDYTVRGKVHWTPGDGWDIIFGTEYNNNRNTLGDLFQQIYGPPACLGCLLGGIGPSSFYQTSQDFTRPYTTSYISTNLRIEKDFDKFSVTNVAGYRRTKFGSYSDVDGTNLPLYDYTLTGVFKTASDDLQISSKFGGPFQFVVGGFYLHDIDDLNGGFSGAFFGPLAPNAFNLIKTESASVFGEAYLNATDRLKLTVGGRYNYDHKTEFGQLNPDGVAFFMVPPGSTYGATLTTHSFTPRFVLDYKADFGTFYVSRNKGFKSGGFSSPAFGPEPVVKPSDVVSYEAGAKLNLLNNKLHTQTAVFYYDASNLQVQTTVLPGGIITTNAGKSRGYGVEAGLQYVLLAGLDLELSGSYLHARYLVYPNANSYSLSPMGGYTLGEVDLAGSQVEQSPNWSGSAAISYAFDVGNWKADLHAVGRYTGRYFFYAGGESPNQISSQNAFVLINLSANLSPIKGPYRFGLFMDNASNAKYNNGIPVLSTGAFHNAAIGRTFGGNVRVDF